MPAPANRLVIALAQIPSIVGDIDGNLQRLREARAEAAAFGANLVMAPELYLSGYPPEDLVLKPAFQEACRRRLRDAGARDRRQRPCRAGRAAVERGWRAVQRRGATLGTDGSNRSGSRSTCRTTACSTRNASSAPVPAPGPLAFDGVRIGVPICEDIWTPDPIECIVETGGEILLAPNASPYERDKLGMRLKIAQARVAESGPAAGLSQPGRRPGRTGVRGRLRSSVDSDGSLAAQLPAFRTLVARTVWERGATSAGGASRAPREPAEQGDEGDYAACVLGLRDYVDNNRFPGVVLGLSGGIDSALCAAMAVDALGPERVHAVMLPYRFTAQESLRDAAACAKALGVRYDVAPIAEPVEGVEHALAACSGRPRDVTEENIQSRARGLILMSISNKFGAMVVTTGNKSEMSVGYATLYGDMNGGFNPIKDVYKTEVFRLATLRNRWRPVGAKGPEESSSRRKIIVRPPTAELRENQKDEDSLPPYPILDAILHRLVEQEMRLSDIVAEGFEAETVRKIERLLYLAEYKRRQSAPASRSARKTSAATAAIRSSTASAIPFAAADARRVDRAARPQGTSERFEE